MACCAPERASCSVLVQYRLRSEVTACILFSFDLQCELKEREKEKKRYSGTPLNSVSPGQALKLIQA